MKGKRLFKRLTAVLTALLVTITGLPGFELVSAADIEPIVHVADAPTIDGWKDVFLHADSNTENAGGIWVDKSVFDTSASFDGRTVALSDENNFLVSLSAIASTKSITGYSYIPTDTVLVLDISGSMFSSTKRQTRQSSRFWQTTITTAAALFYILQAAWSFYPSTDIRLITPLMTTIWNMNSQQPLTAAAE